MKKSFKLLALLSLLSVVALAQPKTDKMIKKDEKKDNKKEDKKEDKLHGKASSGKTPEKKVTKPIDNGADADEHMSNILQNQESEMNTAGDHTERNAVPATTIDKNKGSRAAKPAETKGSAPAPGANEDRKAATPVNGKDNVNRKASEAQPVPPSKGDE